MTEDQKKPKATLIKHKKTDLPAPAEEAQEKSEKKKVVVIKKKVVVVKKGAPRSVEAAHPQATAAEVAGTETTPVAAVGGAGTQPAAKPAAAKPVEPPAGEQREGQPAKTAAAAPPREEARPPQAGEAGGQEVRRVARAGAESAGFRQPEPPAHAFAPGSAREGEAAPRPTAARAAPPAYAPGPAEKAPAGKPPAAYVRQPAGKVPEEQGVQARSFQPPKAPRTPAAPPSPAGARPPAAASTAPAAEPSVRPISRQEWRPQPRPEGRADIRDLRGPRPGMRGPGGPGRPDFRGRPGGPGGGRPFRGPEPRPGGLRTGARPGTLRPGPAPVSTEEAKKGGAKKFFKAKKKGPFVKKTREEEREKAIQVKKKQVARANPIPKEISIMEVITVSELAKKLNLKGSELVAKLMSMGMMVTINQQIDAETATLLAEEYGSKVNIVSLYDETQIQKDEGREEDRRPRPPIVTIMGHVDHGKTKLLDAIRSTDVVATEFGGITQHIGAYMVELPQGRIVFLDTPGHEAFTTMRARGAQVTDLVVLVVSAVDGVMPQTVEAIHHAKAAKVPIIVAVNKIDLPDANPDNVKKQLSEHDLVPEAWGGHTLYVEVSALKKIGIDTLLETILLQAEILELKANYDCRAEGRIIESKIDLGRGIVSTVLVQRGTLRIGDSFVAGVFPGKVRAMFNDKGQRLEEATPSMPVEIVGFTGIPNAGDPFQVTESEKEARQVGDKRQELKKMEEAKNVKKITLDNLYEQIKEGEVQELRVIVKGDVHGSVEALQTALEKLSTSEIRLIVIHAAAGAINRDDVMLASASNAIIIGFNVRPTTDAQATADREKVEIRRYNVIYEAVEDVRSAMEGLLAPELKEQTLGVAEVRELFKISRVGTIAGCHVLTGKIRRNAACQVVRDGVVVYRGKILSLKRFKEDAREVEAGYECGIGVENYNDLKVGDHIEALETIELAKKLDRKAGSDGGAKAEES